MYEINASLTDCYSLYQETVNKSLESELVKFKIENDDLRNKLIEAERIIDNLLTLIDCYKFGTLGKFSSDWKIETIKHAEQFLKK